MRVAGTGVFAGGEPIPTGMSFPTSPLLLWFEDAADDQQRLLISFGDLIDKIGTKDAPANQAQLTASYEILGRSGIALEPDFRPGRRKLTREDLVLLYRPQTLKLQSEATARKRLWVDAAITIAASDGEVTADQVDDIIEHLESRKLVPESEVERFTNYGVWLARTKRYDNNFTRLKSSAMTNAQRTALGALIIAIALRDGTVTENERRSVQRAYKAIGLPLEQLDEILTPATAAVPGAAPGTAATSPGISIDWAAVARLQAETVEVQAILATTLNTDDLAAGPEEVDAAAAGDSPVASHNLDSSITSPAASNAPSSGNSLVAPVLTVATSFPGLDPRAVQVIQQLRSHSEVTAQQLKSICQGSGLLPNAAIDVINEWADEHLGDRLIDGEGPYSIASNLLPAATPS